MRVTFRCYSCLERLVYRTSELATSNSEIKLKAIAAGLEVLRRDFPSNKIPTQIAGELQRVIRGVTGNQDPFRAIKEKEIKISALIFAEVSARLKGDLNSCIHLSVLGNALDFFRDPELLRKEMVFPVQFTLDDTDKLATQLKGVKKILFLADNAGECFFDLPLIKKLEEGAEVIYAVKAGPVQDDLTLEELALSGLRGKLEKVITTGTDTPGLDLSLVSPEFKREFDSADLIIAKGMGHYETLSELSLPRAVFYLLRAKCEPVAASLGAPLNSYIAKLE